MPHFTLLLSCIAAIHHNSLSCYTFGFIARKEHSVVCNLEYIQHNKANEQSTGFFESAVYNASIKMLPPFIPISKMHKKYHGYSFWLWVGSVPTIVAGPVLQYVKLTRDRGQVHSTLYSKQVYDLGTELSSFN